MEAIGQGDLRFFAEVSWVDGLGCAFMLTWANGERASTGPVPL